MPRPGENDTAEQVPEGASAAPSRPARPPGGEAPEGGPTEEELRQLARDLAATPVEEIVANHCYGLFELGALHLSQEHVDLKAARLAIDALGYLVDGLGERLGAHAGTLADAVTQIRLAYVRIADSGAARPESPPAPAAAPAEGGGRPEEPEPPGEGPP